MGQELACIVRWENKISSGKALLETSELLFRGEFRLKVPFSTIKNLHAGNGELRMSTADGFVVLELGDKAEKWLQKIANPKSVMEKLGVKSGDRVAVFGKLEADFLSQLKGQKCPVVKGRISPETMWIFLAASKKEDLELFKHAAREMVGKAALWVLYAKGQKSLTEMDVITAGRKAGLKDVKVVGFSPSHTALKFVIPLSKR